MPRKLQYARPLCVGEAVRVYRNLNARAFSVQARVDGRWRVVAHVRDIEVHDARWYVSHSTRCRSLAAGQRSVHAWAEGVLVALCEPADAGALPWLTYEWTDGTFRADGVEINGRARRVVLFRGYCAAVEM